MSSNKILKITSNVTLVTAVIIAVYALYKTYTSYSNLPPGVCPIENYRPYMYVAIALSILSLVVGYIEQYLKKREGNQ